MIGYPEAYRLARRLAVEGETVNITDVPTKSDRVKVIEQLLIIRNDCNLCIEQLKSVNKRGV